MESLNESMLKTLESFGPQLFDISGSLTLWEEIIGTNDNNSINSLLDLIENKNCDQKYNLAKLILIEGFDKVVNDSKSMTTTIETVVDSRDEEQNAYNSRLITPDLTEEESNESNINSNDMFIQTNVSKNMSEEDEELIIDLSKSSELHDSSGSYVDASEESTKPKSQDSYKSALGSPTLNVSPNKSLEILVDSHTSSLGENMSSSTPSKNKLEDRLSGQILSLSPITSQYSQSKQCLSPNVSLNMSSISSHSPKSTASSKQSKRSSAKSAEKIIEEYNCLVPYESYSSEQKYLKSNNQTNSESDSILSDYIYDNIIKENIKTIESNK